MKHIWSKLTFNGRLMATIFVACLLAGTISACDMSTLEIMDEDVEYQGNGWDDDTNKPYGNASEEEYQSSYDETVYYFRNEDRLEEHYEKHGIEMGFDSAESYEAAANDVIHNPSALHKYEAEDGDEVFYVEATNDFVIVSTDGYIRTYFRPDRGIDYYNKQ